MAPLVVRLALKISEASRTRRVAGARRTEGRMVKCVEELSAKFERFALANLESLGQGLVEVADWVGAAVIDVARCIAGHFVAWIGECIDIKVKARPEDHV